MWMLALVGFVVASRDAVAQSRTWAKVREQVHDLNGNLVAEQSRILTWDATFPAMQRILLKDMNTGRLFVVRRTITTPYTHASASVERVGVGQLVAETSSGGAGTLMLCGSSVAFSDLGPIEAQSQSVLNEADAILDSCPDTKADLERIVILGLQYDEEIEDVAFILRSLLRDFATVAEIRGGTITKLSTIKPFDPNTAPPDSFEQQFGQAYYE
jgi:hypothetical protein